MFLSTIPGMVHLTRKTNQSYLIPTDVNPDRAERGYGLEMLERNLEFVKRKIGDDRHVVLVLDASFSGESAGGALQTKTRGAYKPVMPKVNRSLTRLSASAASQIANWDKKTEHGLMTSIFLKGVRGAADKEGFGNGDGKISWQEIGKFLQSEVSYRARRDHGRDQTPQIGGVENVPWQIESAKREQQVAVTTDAKQLDTAAKDAEQKTTDAPVKLDLPKEKVVKLEAPKDPVALKAFKVLEKHCARCHQEGKLNRLKPAKNFGNVLRLDQITKDANLILPGNPDGSRLYVQMVKQEMPYDTYQEFDGEEPTDAELDAVRVWIQSLGEQATASCKNRDFISNADIVKVIAEDLSDARDHELAGKRYVSLAQLYNACVSDEEMKVYRQAVVKLLNSLSRNSDVLTLRTIDKAKTIIGFHLDDLKWDADDWERVLATYPYGIKSDIKLFDFIAASTTTALPYVRGDWLAFTASRPPLYHDLLKMPSSFDQLQFQLGLNVPQNVRNYRVKRAGFQNSLVSRNNRLIERHTINTGVFWTSYDFAGNRANQSLLEHPLGPEGRDAFQADGGETIFTLPNGFNAYYLNTSAGQRLDTGPTAIVQDVSQRDLLVTNGISCFGCHNQGFRKATDEVRTHVLADRTFPKSVREAVEALYPPVEEMSKLIERDLSRFRGAMRQAGLDPDLDYNGVEMINALSKYYEKRLDLRQAAAEYGLKPDDILAGLESTGGQAIRLKRRLEQGLVPRDQFEGLFAKFVGNLSDDEPIRVAYAGTALASNIKAAKFKPLPKEVSHDFNISLFSDKSRYRVGDLAVFRVQSQETCHLTLVNIDKTGDGTVIFPNRFDQNNLLAAGKELTYPGPNAPFQFRLRDPGVETVVAICNASTRGADNIRHDFKTKQFTVLGDYRSFMREVTRQNNRAFNESRKIGVEAADKGPKRPGGAKPKIIARTAIRFEVH